MPVAWDDILSAYEFASAAGFDNKAFLSRESGEVFWLSEDHDTLDELPEDIDDHEKYLRLPNSRDLDLGTRLVMRFAAEELEGHQDDVADICRRRGAYRHFKDLLARVGALDKWHAFEEAATQKARREWCAENGVEVE